jgi:hypothetical protein
VPVRHKPSGQCRLSAARFPRERVRRPRAFTGNDDPYKRLKQSLRSEVNDVAWTGRIAVKVINHYGDEVLKVQDLT